MAPKEISEAVGMMPAVSGEAGKPRLRAGSSANLREAYGETGIGILERACDELEGHTDFFKHLRSTGGTCAFVVGLALNGRMAGEVIPAALSERIGSLGFDLELSIYGPDTEPPPTMQITPETTVVR